MKQIVILLSLFFIAQFTGGAESSAELKNLSLSGGIDQGKARLVIEGWLNGPDQPQKSAFATIAQQSIRVDPTRLSQIIDLNIDVVSGAPQDFAFTISGEGEIKQVTGELLQDWSIRQQENGTRTLVLRTKKTEKPVSQLSFKVAAENQNPIREPGTVLKPLVLVPPIPALFNGFVKIDYAQELSIQATEHAGLLPLNPKYLPEAMRSGTNGSSPDFEPLAFRFQGASYTLTLKATVADPEARGIVLRDFGLKGTLAESLASFGLTARAIVHNARGAKITLLAGQIALTATSLPDGVRLIFDEGRYELIADGAGEFPLKVSFDAKVHSPEGMRGWSSVDFRVAPAVLQPLALTGLPADTQFEFPGAAKPQRSHDDFVTFLPADGQIKLSWKSAPRESEGKLFYAAEMMSQISVAPGLMTEMALLDFKVMQGELNRIALLLRGDGEVTRVSGADVLAWNIEAVSGTSDRRLIVQLNQAQRDHFSLQLQIQSPLGPFPQTAEIVQVRPEGATRFAGYFRVTNEGAVRLEVTDPSGVSQISPEKFPETDATRANFRAPGPQRFAYRFSGADFALKIQADQIQPELSLSEVLAYRVAETELTIEVELELDIREAPVRELILNVPKGFVLSTVNISGLSDYFLKELDDRSELRLVLGQPATGRQVLQLRLEKNQSAAPQSWQLPRIELVKAKSVRGYIAVSADAGFRVTPGRTQGLTEIATAFFPRKVPGIQSAFRVTEAAWEAAVVVDRLPQTIQVDALHLFSIGEGVAYGSSVLNYSISGAPVSAFRVEVSDEFLNLEFTGKDIRNWQKTDNGYLVQLHSPVSGAYTLLASYERPFKRSGETLAFSGARPIGTQSDQGYTVIVSAFQFDVKPVELSPGLLPLETREVPSEYRLFFDAPVLAAYRYNSRPFALKLSLTPLAQGESLSLVVDRAALSTHVARQGQVITEARYCVKNRGNPHLRIKIPEGMQLWSSAINGNAVVPVIDKGDNLIPLPQTSDPNAVLTLDLKLASRSASATRLKIAAPILGAPVMLADWQIAPDAGQRLVFRSGSLTPADGGTDRSGFAQLARVLRGPNSGALFGSIGFSLIAIAGAVAAWKWGAETGTYRFSARHLGGGLIGTVLFIIAIVLAANLFQTVQQERMYPSADLRFLAPVQQAGSALSIQVANVPDHVSVLSILNYGWPVIIAFLFWAFAWATQSSFSKRIAAVFGWVIIAWAAARLPNGAGAFLLVLVLYIGLQVVVPVLRRFLSVNPRVEPVMPAPGQTSGATVVSALLLAGVICIAQSEDAFAADASKRMAQNPGKAEVLEPRDAYNPPLPASVHQEARVADKFANVTARLHWTARKGQSLPVLFEPAVLTGISYPTNSVKLVEGITDNKRARQLVVLSDGTFDVELRYELQLTKREAESGIVLPIQHGLVNELKITLQNLDVDVSSPQAVSVHRDFADSNTVAQLVLTPANDVWVGWKPRSRNTQQEKAVFYSELSQLYVPTAGVLEGAHYVSIRPAQGELSEMTLSVPEGATITDVIDSDPAAATNSALRLISLWRFDPDTHKLRVSFSSPQSRPFAFIVRSQLATGALPFQKSAGTISTVGSAGELGMTAVATGNEVQLDTVTATAMSPINLEDFPAQLASLLSGPIPGLTVRRAYRYADGSASLLIAASAVEPDVRVESQDTVSLGEDRVVLAMNAVVEITRAGIFSLSFALPPGFDVESISGAALSHWTELKSDNGRIITLHLAGKTEGKQQFTVSLASGGVKATNAWVVPQVSFREAGKQRGTLLLVPEQGLRLQIVASEGLTQLDPEKSGIKQKGVLAFRILQANRSLTLGLEQVNPWIQVTTLQHVTVAEAQVKVTANAQYQIENTGIKAVHVLIPTNAESVRFTGDQVADFLPLSGSISNGLQAWEIKLHRRVIGSWFLQGSWQSRLPDNATEYRLRGIQALDVNLQRGFVTVQTAGRLQLQPEPAPAALQTAEWQSIPRPLQQGVNPSAANLTYRLIETDFTLALTFQRHEAAKLLPARVNSISLHSAISDEGVMLTQARLQIVPGDERLLRVRLPAQGRFWLAFVNDTGVWPWQQNDQILIPLEKQSRPDAPIWVDVFYTSALGTGPSHPAGHLNLELLAPRFELPLENISWRVSLSEKWKITKWSGALQLEQEQVIPSNGVDLQAYLQTETQQQQLRTKKAEEFLVQANSAIQTGDPQQARRDFQAAYGLSTHDAAFNEDARVQLHNIKLQQALIGLNVRQASNPAEGAAATSKLRELKSRKELNYTQQDAKEIIDRNSDAENAALMRLAERLIQQQDAAISSPAALHANMPEQGRILTFKRAVAVDAWEDLRLELKATAARTASWWFRLCVIAVTFLVLALLSMLRLRTMPPAA